MRGNLYKSKLTGKIYCVLKYSANYCTVTLKGMQPPFTVRGMSLGNLKHYYTPITKE